MKYQLVQTKNLMTLHAAMGELGMRSGGSVPKMGLLVGRTGAGKTTAVASIVPLVNAVDIRAYAAGNLSSLMDAICFKLKVEARRLADKQQVICKALTAKPRPLIIDEADYLCHVPRALDTLRDIHDITGVPVLLVGMSGLEGRLVHLKQLARRVSMHINFEACDIADTRLVADTLCEVGIEDDLLGHLHERSRGCIGLMVVAMARVEAHARELRLESIGLKAWGKRELFLGSEAAE